MERVIFSARTCVDVVNIILDFGIRNGTSRPVPWRMRALMQQLTIDKYAGREATHRARLELVDIVVAASKPWRG